MARVFLARRSVGLYLPQLCSRSRCFCVWLYTVKTRAMLLRTNLILASLDAAPPVTFATRSCEREEEEESKEGSRFHGQGQAGRLDHELGAGATFCGCCGWMLLWVGG